MQGFFNPFEHQKSSGGGGATEASDVSFDKRGTTLTSDNVQDVIVELSQKLSDAISNLSADQVQYTDPLGQLISVNAALNELYQSKKQIYFSTYLEFPVVGEENILYIDKSTTYSYLWDDTTFTYVKQVEDITNYELQSTL